MKLFWFRTGRNRQAVFLSLALFALNAWICHRLFVVEFVNQLQSNEPAFMALSRFYRDHWNDLRWFPWFNGGMPVEDGYMPLVLAVTAALSKITAWSIARSYHAVLAFAYCCGPVTLFWFAFDWSESLGVSAIAGLIFSLLSPSAILLPPVRVNPPGIWAAQRLYNIVYWGEGPHNVTLALLPLALLFLRRAIVRRGRWDLPLAVISSAALVLTNAFGAIAIAIGAVCLVLTLRRGLWITLITGALAWAWILPWLSPSLIRTLRANTFTTRGFYNAGYSTYLAMAGALLCFGLLWFAARRLTSPLERFAWLFAVPMSALPILYFAANVTLAPQAGRYHIEMELALCLLLACVGARLFQHSKRLVRIVIGVAFAFLIIHQGRTYLNFAHDIIRPLDVTRTAEYQVTEWIDHNLAGQRTMVSGDAEFYFNVFSDNPQLSGGHEASAPNFMQQVAVYTIYTGQNAGDKDAEFSIFWLKAFGTQAITVPGPDTREYYKPIVHPFKFDGVLPVLWRGDGDTIYAVPQRSHSLVHVIPRSAIVARQPIHGLDTAPAAAYVAALDNPSLPLASVTWRGLSKATIHAPMTRNQVLAVQVTYDPAWHTVSGSRIRKDGLGLMVIEPDCEGDCQIDLYYGTTPEIWFCRVMSALATVVLIALVFVPSRRSQRPVFPQ